MTRPDLLLCAIRGHHYRVRMPAEGVASTPAAAIPRLPVTARQSSALGITAFALAAFGTILPDVLTALIPDLTEADITGIIGIISIASILPLVLGIVATVTRRGRYWGVAAITLALLANYLVFVLVSLVHLSLGAGSFGAGL
jgi:hypothetical protein